jgi:hypothetical protein
MAEPWRSESELTGTRRFSLTVAVRVQPASEEIIHQPSLHLLMLGDEGRSLLNDAVRRQKSFYHQASVLPFHSDNLAMYLPAATVGHPARF